MDREGFSEAITNVIKSNPNIEIICDEVTEIDPSEPTIIATGPLTADDLANNIIEMFSCHDGKIIRYWKNSNI